MEAKIKEKYLARLRSLMPPRDFMVLIAAGKGCAVGCTIHSSKHSDYELELGLPSWLAYLEDGIFEVFKWGSQRVSHQVSEAIPVGFQWWIMHDFLMVVG